jgi:hypothetical protein
VKPGLGTKIEFTLLSAVVAGGLIGGLWEWLTG